MFNKQTVKVTDLMQEVNRKIKDLLDKRDSFQTMEEFNEAYKPIEREANRVLELILFKLVSTGDSFYGQFLIRLNRKVKLSLGAPAAVSYQGLYYDLIINPILLFQHTPEEISAIMIHEIYHVCNNHITRGKMLFKKDSPYMLNIAMDLSINQFIDNLPKDCVHMNNIEKFIPNVDKSLLKEKDNYENYMKIFKDTYNENQETKDFVNQKDSQMQQGSGDGDGGGAGEILDKIKELMENGGLSEGNNLDDHKMWNESDTQAGDQESKNVLKKIFEDAKNASRGTVPAGIQKAIDELFAPPTITWQQVLKRYIGTVPVPYKKTITRKSRRQPQRADLRGRLSDHEVEIVVGLDTSGSMSNDDIHYALSEIHAIVKNVKSTVTVVECDAEVTRTYELKKPSDIQKKTKGGGGTWFAPVFKYIKDQNKKHVILIYFTDGGGEAYIDKEYIKHFRTLWVLTNPHYSLSVRDLPPAHSEVKIIQPVNERNKK